MPDISKEETTELLDGVIWTSATDLTDLARRIVDAVDEAAQKRSKRHTTVYSVRPLDDDELELIANYVSEHLDNRENEDYDESTETEVRIMVDDQMLEGTLQVGDDPLIENVIDESLIAGIKIVRGDTVIDGSLKRRLEDLRYSMHS
jgi:F0F1-type ATP synthase delta subunit